MPGHFSGTFAGHYICLEHLILVILLRASLSRVNLRLHRLVPRGKPAYLGVLSVPFALSQTYQNSTKKNYNNEMFQTYIVSGKSPGELSRQTTRTFMFEIEVQMLRTFPVL